MPACRVTNRSFTDTRGPELTRFVAHSYVLQLCTRISKKVAWRTVGPKAETRARTIASFRNFAVELQERKPLPLPSVDRDAIAIRNLLTGDIITTRMPQKGIFSFHDCYFHVKRALDLRPGISLALYWEGDGALCDRILPCTRYPDRRQQLRGRQLVAYVHK